MGDDEDAFPLHWLSTCALQTPVLEGKAWARGALILSQVDALVRRVPQLRERFILIERRAWRGVNDSRFADIKLIEDLPLIGQARECSPRAILIPYAPADFVDTDAFCHVDTRYSWDVLQIACWAPYKRIELLIEGASLLPELRFAHIGHFPRGGVDEELQYRDACLRYARQHAPHIEFLSAHDDRNGSLPCSKANVNALLNKARMGVLTSAVEGVNRFKMECLSANRPFLVPADAPWPTRKHINRHTGALFAPTARGLADAISRIREHEGSMSPRAYILAHSGCARAVAELRAALQSVSRTTFEASRFEHITWDGRNQSLLWGVKALNALNKLCSASSP